VNRPPGFIDTHYHAVDPSATKLALREGVTTGMDLEQGAFNLGAWLGGRRPRPGDRHRLDRRLHAGRNRARNVRGAARRR